MALYGTWFLRASTAVVDKQELTEQDVLRLFQAGLDGVLQRGKAQIGDKTMVDVLSPAVVAFGQAVGESKGTLEAMQQAVATAQKGLQETIPMQPKRDGLAIWGKEVSDIKIQEGLLLI